MKIGQKLRNRGTLILIIFIFQTSAFFSCGDSIEDAPIITDSGLKITVVPEIDELNGFAGDTLLLKFIIDHENYVNGRLTGIKSVKKLNGVLIKDKELLKNEGEGLPSPVELEIPYLFSAADIGKKVEFGIQYEVVRQIANGSSGVTGFKLFNVNSSMKD
ncbi:hypothetical protein A33Q_0262 [Indibacter alkaliphilus LW1]|uniref:Uncharacterized protein n=2 Tax=Indibacter TaxID=647744 RepID=S2ECM3_INDAL|nr:hypothetical protein A33Q_0262 [Indibacter alkaliphilus LW1]